MKHTALNFKILAIEQDSFGLPRDNWPLKCVAPCLSRKFTDSSEMKRKLECILQCRRHPRDLLLRQSKNWKQLVEISAIGQDTSLIFNLRNQDGRDISWRDADPSRRGSSNLNLEPNLTSKNLLFG